MSSLPRIVDLLGDVASGGVRDRVVAFARASSLIGSLSADEKRRLAVEVAERVAPHLVPRIEAETGRDLSPEQVATVFDLFRRLDADQVDELRRVLADPDEQVDLLHGVLDGVVTDLGLDVPIVDDGLPAGPQPVPVGIEHDETSPITPVAPPPTPAEPETIRAEDADGPEVEAVETVVVSTTTTTEALPAEPTAPDLLLSEPTAPPERDLPAADLPTVEPPAAPVLDRRGELVDALRAATTATARLALLREVAAELGTLDERAVTSVLEAVPDGWQRRRALDRLVEAGSVPAAAATASARTLARIGDRRWATATLHAAGLVTDAELAGLLDPRTAARIADRRS